MTGKSLFDVGDVVAFVDGCGQLCKGYITSVMIRQSFFQGTSTIWYTLEKTKIETDGKDFIISEVHEMDLLEKIKKVNCWLEQQIIQKESAIKINGNDKVQLAIIKTNEKKDG